MMDAASKGAVSELLVSADLLRAGYEVFRAVSPSASCDLVAVRAGVTLRIEVRSAHRKSNGNTYIGTPDRSRSDVIAVVLDGSIHYDPPLWGAPTIEFVGLGACFRVLPGSA